jgi:hypothetical protein
VVCAQRDENGFLSRISPRDANRSGGANLSRLARDSWPVRALVIDARSRSVKCKRHRALESHAISSSETAVPSFETYPFSIPATRALEELAHDPRRHAWRARMAPASATRRS